MNTDNQILIVVDDDDNFLGYEKRKPCHAGKGIHHRAFVVLLENKKGEVLLQKRKHKLWDNYWDTSAISHPLHLENGDESYEEAGNRTLKSEMGIPSLALKNIGGFNYFVAHGENCENEYCAILLGEYNGKVTPDEAAVYEYKWVPKQNFINDCLNENPEYTPWAILTGKFMNENKTTNSDFKTYLESTKEKIEKEIADVLLKTEEEAKSTHESLAQLTKAFSESNHGGKKMRGALVRLGFEMTGKTNPEIIKAAASYEIMHASILAHDDIIDKSPLRRGQKSLYQKLGGGHYGISQTISLADLGFFLAFEILLKSDFPSQEKNNALEFFARTMQQTALGELLDVELPTKSTKPTDEEIITIMKLKTSYYSIAGPLRLGAILGGAGEKLLSQLALFGEYLGIAFQIQDDILGIFGKEQEIGKSITSDIAEGKYTLLYVYAQEGSSERQKQTLKKYYGKANTTPKKAEIIRNIMLETGALEQANKIFDQNIQKAKDVVSKFENKKVKKILNEIISYVAARKN